MASSLRSARHTRLAEMLAQHRRDANLKQAEVAQRLGRHQPFIANIEAGERRVDLVELLDLAEAIGFDPCKLIEELLSVPKG
jgi:transcriptional regulator with XRE-family HTH domain